MGHPEYGWGWCKATRPYWMEAASANSLLCGDGAFEPCEKELVAYGEDDGAHEEADDAHRNESTDSTEEDDSGGNGCAAPQQYGLQHVVDEADEGAPNQKQYCLGGAGDRKHVDDRRDEDNESDLKDRGEEKDQGPQSCAGESGDQKSQTGQYGLDYCDTEDSVGDASDRRSCEFLVLRALIAEESVCKRVRDRDATGGIREQNSSEYKGQDELQDGEADTCRGGEQGGDHRFDLRSEALQEAGQICRCHVPCTAQRHSDEGPGCDAVGWRGDGETSILDVSGEVLGAVDHGFGEQGDGNDQDGEEEQGSKHCGERSPAAKEALELSVCRIDGDCDDDSPGDERNKRVQDQEAGDCEECEQANVDKDFNGALNVIVRGCLCGHGYVLLCG